jgi:glyceraldehyde 3-phosphate dehydrogenase
MSAPLIERARSTLDDYLVDEKHAEALVPIIGDLYRKNVVVKLCGRPLSSKTVPEILETHEFAQKHFSADYTVTASHAILAAMRELTLSPMRVDVGLTRTMLKEVFEEAKPEEFQERLKAALSEHVGKMEAGAVRDNPLDTPRDVVLYGFGRIGRLLARLLVEKTGAGVKMVLRAIVVRPKSKESEDLKKRASLLLLDSVHGRFAGTVTYNEEDNTIVANGNVIKVIYSKGPSEVDYTKYGISDAIVVDNTGIWRDKRGLSVHRACPGVSKVVLTAPAKGGDVPTVVCPINYDRVVDGEDIYSAASCTTNAIAPLLKLLSGTIGVKSGHIETVHAFTNDQNLLDNYHAKARRSRAAPLNMVLTETGAGKAVALALPEMAGKLTANAIRVPTPNVSMVILSLDMEKEVTKEEINALIKQESLDGDMHLQIGFGVVEDAVSMDYVGERHTCVVDSHATIAKGNRVNIYAWYDNEYGYSCQVVRLIQRIAGINFPDFPPTTKHTKE